MTDQQFGAFRESLRVAERALRGACEIVGGTESLTEAGETALAEALDAIWALEAAEVNHRREQARRRLLRLAPDRSDARATTAS